MNSRQLKKPVFGPWALDDVFVGGQLVTLLRLRFVGYTYIYIHSYIHVYILVRICSSSNGHVTSGGYLPLTNGWSVGSINTSGSLRIWTSEPLDPNVGLTNAASPYEGILDVCITSSYWWTAESLQSGSEESVKWSTKVNWLLKRIHHFSSTGGYWKHLVSWNKPGVSFSWSTIPAPVWILFPSWWDALFNPPSYVASPEVILPDLVRRFLSGRQRRWPVGPRWCGRTTLWGPVSFHACSSFDANVECSWFTGELAWILFVLIKFSTVGWMNEVEVEDPCGIPICSRVPSSFSSHRL